MRQSVTGICAFLRARQALLLAVAFYVAVAAIFGWALLVMLRGQLPDHADGLWVVSFAHDLLQDIPLRGWRLPGAPAYFPELLSVLVSRSLGFGVRTSLLIHGVGTWLAIGAGVYWGLRLGHSSVVSALRISLCVLMGFVLLNCGAGALLQPFEFPFSHGGAVLVSLFGSLYIAHGLERGFAFRVWAVASLLLGLSCSSDRAVVAQFVAPAAVLVLLLVAFRMGARSRLFWALGLLATGLLIGWMVTTVARWGIGLSPGGFSSRYGVAKSARTLLRVYDDLRELALERPGLALSVVAPLLFLGWRSALAVRECLRCSSDRPGEQPPVSAQAWLAWIAVAIPISAVGAVAATNLWEGPTSFRYLLPLFLLPLPLAVIVAAPLQWRIGPGWARLCELTLLFLLVMVATRAERRTPRRVALMDTPARACLDAYLQETGLRAGYAEYWVARPSMLLSQADVTLAQVTGRLAAKRWADNRFWYTRGFTPGPQRPLFSFVIPQRLDARWLAERFGPPRVQRDCFGFQIWVYDRPADLEFRNYLRGGVARATADDPEWWSVVGSDPADMEENETSSGLRFGGAKGASVRLPHVRANVIELNSPTRKPLHLSYRRAGVEAAAQDVDFSRDTRRMLALPAALDLESVDSLFISGSAQTRYELKRVAFLWDPAAESIRR